MKILTIFLSSINRYGIKFLFAILFYEILNIHRFRFKDYLVLDPIKKKYEPCVPTPFYCLSLIKKKILKKKYIFIDFGCGRGRVLNFFSNIKNLEEMIGIEINKLLEKELIKLKNKKTKIYMEDCTSKNFINFLIKKYLKKNLILYFYHPFSQKMFEKIIEKFLSNSKKEVKIIVIGKIYLSPKIRKKFKIKVERIHNLLNIYNYQYR